MKRLLVKSVLINVGSQLFSSAKTNYSRFRHCLRGAFRSVTRSFTRWPPSFSSYRAPGSFGHRTLCSAMITHAYFCAQSGLLIKLEVGFLIKTRIFVKLSAENIQKMNNPRYQFPQERIKSTETRAMLAHCCPMSLR